MKGVVDDDILFERPTKQARMTFPMDVCHFVIFWSVLDGHVAVRVSSAFVVVFWVPEEGVLSMGVTYEQRVCERKVRW